MKQNQKQKEILRAYGNSLMYLKLAKLHEDKVRESGYAIKEEQK